MYQRPKIGETDEDLLKLQEEFNKFKAQKDFKLASTISKPSSNDIPRQQSSLPIPEIANNEIQEHLDNTFEDIPQNMQIGGIVERKSTTKVPHVTLSKTGFPQAKRRTVNHTIGKGSIFSQQMKKLKTNNDNMDISNTDNKLSNPTKKNTITEANISIQERFKPGTSSNVKQNDEIISVKQEIHKENLDKMSKMTPEEILEERERLMSTLDPAIIAFLKSKRHHTENKIETRQPSIAQQNKPIDVEDVSIDELATAKEILNQPESEKWIHFDMLESNKLAWMKDISKPIDPKNAKYEARFDFAGWLLPYAHEEINDRNRILYHHGEEPGRPGYTLQELFQLCRSNVIQQKVIALNTIAAILNLHSSGLYDHVIELPIEQVFFVLRFCLDENTPATLNSSIKALRNLFCSSIDETCLDCLLGFGLIWHTQPILAVDENKDDNTVNDQQIAEENLVKCLYRSGILTRIRYIFSVVKPTDIETVTNCLDILIRLSRDSEFIVEELFKFDGLISCIVEYFMPQVFATVKSTTAYNTPIIQAVKLMRCLASRSKNIASELYNRYKILDSVVTYLSNEFLSLNTMGLKLQIESLQLWETLIYYELGLEYFKILRPVLLRLLDYHLKNTNVDSSWTIQTHTASIFNLLSQVAKYDYNSTLEYVKMLFDVGLPKWITQFSSIHTYSCGKLQLIASLFNLLTSIYKYQPLNVHLPWENIYKLVEKLLLSDTFNILTENLKSSSNILNNYELHKSSANLLFSEAAAWNTADHIIPLLQTKSSMPFITCLIEFICNSKSNNLKLMLLKNNNINLYLQQIKSSYNFYMTSNWYTSIEIQIIKNILKIAVQIQKDLDTSLYYEVAVKSLCVFTEEMKTDVEYLFDNIIFNKDFYPSDVLLKHLNLDDETILKTALQEIMNIKQVYIDVLGLNKNLLQLDTKRALKVIKTNIMPLDWVYSPIIALYSNSDPSKVSEATQNFIISNCLRWVYIYETYFPELADMINPTDKFCRLACTFLGSDTLFLIPEIQQLLRSCLQQILQKHQSKLDFGKAIHGLQSFEDLYKQLLEQYQGVSYGDKLFGQFLLVPLAQRHSVKLRKCIWSEYAAIIQIFNLTEAELLLDIKNYLEPLEEDMSLLKCYHRILSIGAVRNFSVFYKIAKHHLDGFKNKKKEEEKKSQDKMDV